MQFFPIGKIYNFNAQRTLFGWISVFLVVASVVSVFIPGPQMGTDFKGGTEIEVAFKQAVSEEAVRSAIEAAGFSSPDLLRVNSGDHAHHLLIRVKEVSTIEAADARKIEAALCFADQLDTAKCPEDKRPTEVKFSPGGDKITVRYRSEPDLAAIKGQLADGVGGVSLREGDNNPSLQNARDNRVEILLKSKGGQLMAGLMKALGPDTVPETALRVEWVGPKAGALLRDAALKSIAVTLIFIMIYIAVRFDLRFAPGAVLSLVHDAVATLGVLIFLGREINLTTVAALLTIVGYSVTDTVVVYDRVRENFSRLRGATFDRIINVSLSEMLSRTVLTSGTTILSLTCLLIWGTGALKDFAFTLIIGIILGNYSSIYVALPLTHWLDTRFFAKFAPKKAKSVGAKKAEAVV
ncbi:MAG: hypothetical protein RJA70_2220 [Pseudomonadota bacterium]|jgi:preprotein translocase subunit SecF